MKNQRGISIIGTVFTLIILGVMGAAIISIVSIGQESRIKQINKIRAFYASQAGFEYGIREVRTGGYPVVDKKPFDSSTFTLFMQPDVHKMNVIGEAGDSTSIHKITVYPLGADCLVVDPSEAMIEIDHPERVTGINLYKECLEAITVSSVRVAWSPNHGERLLKVLIGGIEVYSDSFGVWSDVEVDTSDYKIEAGGPINVQLEFSQSMSEEILTLTFITSDTSSVTRGEVSL